MTNGWSWGPRKIWPLSLYYLLGIRDKTSLKVSIKTKDTQCLSERVYFAAICVNWVSVFFAHSLSFYSSSI